MSCTTTTSPSNTCTILKSRSLQTRALVPNSTSFTSSVKSVVEEISKADNVPSSEDSFPPLIPSNVVTSAFVEGASEGDLGDLSSTQSAPPQALPAVINTNVDGKNDEAKNVSTSKMTTILNCNRWQVDKAFIIGVPSSGLQEIISLIGNNTAPIFSSPNRHNFTNVEDYSDNDEFYAEESDVKNMSVDFISTQTPVPLPSTPQKRKSAKSKKKTLQAKDKKQINLYDQKNAYVIL